MKKAAEKVLCYHFDAETLEAVRIVMKKLGVECRALPEERGFQISVLEAMEGEADLMRFFPAERKSISTEF